jgi:hypothetical protein
LIFFVWFRLCVESCFTIPHVLRGVKEKKEINSTPPKKNENKISSSRETFVIIYTDMKKKNKVYRHCFAFDEKTDTLLRSLSSSTDIQMTLIVQRGIEMFAEKKGIKL